MWAWEDAKTCGEVPSMKTFAELICKVSILTWSWASNIFDEDSLEGRDHKFHLGIKPFALSLQLTWTFFKIIFFEHEEENLSENFLCGSDGRKLQNLTDVMNMNERKKAATTRAINNKRKMV